MSTDAKPATDNVPPMMRVLPDLVHSEYNMKVTRPARRWGNMTIIVAWVVITVLSIMFFDQPLYKTPWGVAFFLAGIVCVAGLSILTTTVLKKRFFRTRLSPEFQAQYHSAIEAIDAYNAVRDEHSERLIQWYTADIAGGDELKLNGMACELEDTRVNALSQWHTATWMTAAIMGTTPEPLNQPRFSTVAKMKN